MKLPDNLAFVKLSGQIATSINGSRSPVWFFGAFASGTKRSTCRISAIPSDTSPVITENLPVNSSL
jgi:hypothetical protein